jgi:photosystem I subunit V
VFGVLATPQHHVRPRPHASCVSSAGGSLLTDTRAVCVCAAPPHSMNSMMASSTLTARPAMAGRKVQMRARVAPARRVVATKALSDVNVTVTACNAAMLFLGRFAFMPYQRAQIAKAGLPTQNGATHEASGDSYAKEASFITSTNDPAGASCSLGTRAGTVSQRCGHVTSPPQLASLTVHATPALQSAP